MISETRLICNVCISFNPRNKKWNPSKNLLAAKPHHANVSEVLYHLQKVVSVEWKEKWLADIKTWEATSYVVSSTRHDTDSNAILKLWRRSTWVRKRGWGSYSLTVGWGRYWLPYTTPYIQYYKTNHPTPYLPKRVEIPGWDSDVLRLNILPCRNPGSAGVQYTVVCKIADSYLLLLDNWNDLYQYKTSL